MKLDAYTDWKISESSSGKIFLARKEALTIWGFPYIFQFQTNFPKLKNCFLVARKSTKKIKNGFKQMVFEVVLIGYRFL
jgi:hypothetical protein